MINNYKRNMIVQKCIRRFKMSGVSVKKKKIILLIIY